MINRPATPASVSPLSLPFHVPLAVKCSVSPAPSHTVATDSLLPPANSQLVPSTYQSVSDMKLPPDSVPIILYVSPPSPLPDAVASRVES